MSYVGDGEEIRDKWLRTEWACFKDGRRADHGRPE